MFSKWAIIVFYSDGRKDFVCLFDGARDEQIVSTDIWDRDPLMRDLVPEKIRLPFRETDLWTIAGGTYSFVFGYSSE